jgi:hypothetical protein
VNQERKIFKQFLGIQHERQSMNSSDEQLSPEESQEKNKSVKEQIIDPLLLNIADQGAKLKKYYDSDEKPSSEEEKKASNRLNSPLQLSQQ